MKSKFLLVVLVLMVACSGDDVLKNDQEGRLPIIGKNLVGTWLAIESFEISTASDSIIFKTIGKNDRYSYQFKPNHVVISKDFKSNNIHKGTYSIVENKIEMDFPKEETFAVYIKSLTQDTLIIRRSFGFEGIIIKLKKLNL